MYLKHGNVAMVYGICLILLELQNYKKKSNFDFIFINADLVKRKIGNKISKENN